MPRYTRSLLTRAATCNQKAPCREQSLQGAFYWVKMHLTFVALNVIMFLGYRKRGENMVDKLGRPTNNPKQAPINVRLDNECTKILEEYCQQENTSRAEAIRRGIVKLRNDIEK